MAEKNKSSKKRTAAAPLFFISAGEHSGDIHAARLIRELKKKFPHAIIYAMGGDAMARAGAKIITHYHDIAIIGFTEALMKYPKAIRILNMIAAFIESKKIRNVICVDAPGFNLRLARKIDAPKRKIFYYICPQLWAWGTKRIEYFKRHIDHALVIFPFEERLYRNAGVPVTFIGHPLADIRVQHYSKSEIRRQLGIGRNKKTLLLLPGSRKAEIKRHLPLMLDTAEKLQGAYPDITFICAATEALTIDAFNTAMENRSVPVILMRGKLYTLLSVADAALAASGTVTLELARFEIPMAIFYRTSPLNYHITKMLIRIPYVGLVNIVAEKFICREFIQHDARSDELTDELLSIIHKGAYRRKMIQALRTVKAKVFTKTHVAKNAAAVIAQKVT